jgi:eukaryotic-like serine/threonine-protein kinase
MYEPPLSPGQLVAGKYLIERELGRGGMGVVYVVQHRDMGKRLALKCVLPEYVQDAGTVERFMREARAAGSIHHRNVVDVFDVGRDGNVLYMVMELLEGKPLSHLLQDETLTLEGALLILVRAMEGIEAAHAQGVIHRDIKPDNIFVSHGSDGKLDDPKVLDFGVSKSVGAADGTLTAVGAAVGTPYYMSLEQLTGARDLDLRVDIYAMGVVLYEAIAGVLPHKATNVSALAIRVMTTPPTPLHELRPDLPPGLCDAIMRAISRDRWQRQPSMRALIDEIRPFAAQSAGLSLPSGTARPLRTPRASRVPEASGLPAAQVGGGTDLSDGGSASSEQRPAAPATAWSNPPFVRSRTWRYLAVALLWLGLIVGGGYAIKRKHEAALTLPPGAPELGARPGHPTAPVGSSPAESRKPTTTGETLAIERPATNPPRATTVPGDAGAEQAEEVMTPATAKTGKASARLPRHEHRARVTRDAGVMPAATARTPSPPPRAPELEGKIPVPEEVRGRGGKIGRDEF